MDMPYKRASALKKSVVVP